MFYKFLLRLQICFVQFLVHTDLACATVPKIDFILIEDVKRCQKRYS